MDSGRAAEELDEGDQYEIVVLGPVALRLDGEMEPVRGQQGKVLALLAAAYPAAVPVDALVEALWGDSPPTTARSGLGVVLHRLRERLGDTNRVVNEHNGYRLAVEATQIDAVAFETRCAAARAAFEGADPESARLQIGAALALWRGDAYQPFDSETLRLASIELNERRCDAEDLMFESLLVAGRADEAANWAQRLVAATPYREGRWFSLALSLYRCQRQAEALRSINEASRILRDEIGVEIGPELRQLEIDILDQADHLSAPLASHLTTDAESTFGASEMLDVSEPITRIGDPETTYLGRDDDIEAVALMLDAGRFVTVLGSAGTGKTRLVARLVRSLRQRVIWIDLASLSAEDLLSSLAGELGITSTNDDRVTRVGRELADQPTVVVLDNCEHVVESARSLAGLIVSSARSSQVVATSRVALDHPNENCYLLPALSIDAGAGLVVDRAFGRGSNTEVDLDRVHDLVRRLDANPLLIELVAEPVRTLSVEAVSEQLERVLGEASRATSDDRHASFTQAIDWSVRLLDEPLQQLFAALGAMRGTFTSSDVAKITGTDESGIDSQLATLCRHGLLTADARTGPTLYRQPEAVGIDARSRLDAHGSAVILGAHTDAYVALVDGLSSRLWTSDEALCVKKLGYSRGQLAATHERLVASGDASRAASFAVSMWDYSFLRLDISQFDWAADVLKVDGVAETAHYAELLGTAAMAAWAQNDYFESIRLADASIEAAGAGDIPLQALRARFNVASFREPDRGPMQAFGELISATIDRGPPHLRCDLEVLLALGLLQIGETDGADQSAARAIATAERTMNPSCLAWASYGLGWSKLYADPAEASRLFLAAARQARTVGNRFVEAMANGGLATSARRRDRPTQARTLLIEAIGTWDRLQSTPQLIRSCREAVLLLVELGEQKRAQIALTQLELADLGHPLTPLDQQRYDELGDELGYLDDPAGFARDGSIADSILELLR